MRFHIGGIRRMGRIAERLEGSDDLGKRLLGHREIVAAGKPTTISPIAFEARRNRPASLAPRRGTLHLPGTGLLPADCHRTRYHGV
jgi:hypothetical protein